MAKYHKCKSSEILAYSVKIQPKNIICDNKIWQGRNKFLTKIFKKEQYEKNKTKKNFKKK